MDLLSALQEHAFLQNTAPIRSELNRVENWLWERMENSRNNNNSRTRIWLIFMLLRYGGMRLREIMALTPQECQFGAGRLQLPDRNVFLPADVALRIDKVWTHWPGSALDQPLLCDASQLRHTLLHCGVVCGVRSMRLNASNLRRQRELELETEGLHPRLVAFFLGKSVDPVPYGRAVASHLIETHIKVGMKMKTSARNVFRGRIVNLNENGILVEVVIETVNGLKVTVVITKTSFQSMQLACGKEVTALVKAPWVNVVPKENRAEAPYVNCFEGKVESVQRDNMACEILVHLECGIQVCALYAGGASPSASIENGSDVVISFSPFAAILTEN